MTTNMNGVHCHASAITTEMYGQRPSSVKFVVIGPPGSSHVAIWLAGPIGCRRNRSQKPPTTTGLMNSGITTSTIRMRRPRNGRSIARASNRPRMNSTATADSARIAVTLTEFHQTGSIRLSWKLSRPTHGWSFDTEKSYSTNRTQSEKTSGKTERSKTRETAGHTIRYLKWRSAQEETAPDRLLLGGVASVISTPADTPRC